LSSRAVSRRKHFITRFQQSASYGEDLRYHAQLEVIFKAQVRVCRPRFAKSGSVHTVAGARKRLRGIF
jgi:hypothetical protein